MKCIPDVFVLWGGGWEWVGAGAGLFLTLPSHPVPHFVLWSPGGGQAPGREKVLTPIREISSNQDAALHSSRISPPFLSFPVASCSQNSAKASIEMTTENGFIEIQFTYHTIYH